MASSLAQEDRAVFPGLEHEARRYSRSNLKPGSRALWSNDATSELALIGWYAAGKCGIEETLLQLYFGRFSLAEVDSAVSSIWGRSDGAGLVREFVPEVLGRIDQWLARPTQKHYPYLYLYSVPVRIADRSAGHFRVVAALGIDAMGYRDVLCLRATRFPADYLWDSVIVDLQKRGMDAPALVIGENDESMRRAVANWWDTARFQASASDLKQKLLTEVAPSDFHWVDTQLGKFTDSPTRIHAESAGQKLVAALAKAGYTKQASDLNRDLGDYFSYFEFPKEHWRRLRGPHIGRSELTRLRERLRRIGPINNTHAITLLVAAGFRQTCRRLWNVKPALSI